MMDPALIEALGQFGPMGLMVGYLVWREQRRDKIDRDRIEADVKMAEAISILTVKLEGLNRG